MINSRNIIPLFCIVNLCLAANLPKVTAPVEHAVIGRFDEKFPANPADIEEFLGSKFINAVGHEQFRGLNTDNWKEAFGQFQSALIKHAKKQKLPHAALKRSLDTIMTERKDLAIVPIAAYLTKLTDNEAWIVVCLWEDDIAGKTFTPPPSLEKPAKPATDEHISLGISHVRVFVYYTKDNLLGAFATCL